MPLVRNRKVNSNENERKDIEFTDCVQTLISRTQVQA